MGILLQGAGALLSGAAGGRDQTTSQKQHTSGTQTYDLKDTQAGQSTATGTQSGFNMPVEDPMTAMFRQGLFPLMAQEYAKSQRPVYGEGMIAKQLQDIQGQYSGVSDKILSSLASVGALESGRTASTLMQPELAQASQKSQFLEGLPFMEEQRRSQGAANWMQIMQNLTGRAPVGQVTGGTTQQDQSYTGEATKTGTVKNISDSTSSVTQKGDLWGSIMSSFGGMLGQIGSGSMGGGGGDAGARTAMMPMQSTGFGNAANMALPGLQWVGPGTANFGWTP